MQANGSYYYDEETETFYLEIFEITAFSKIPGEFQDTLYQMKKIDDNWQIALQPNKGGDFVPLHTIITDILKEYILDKHYRLQKIVYPHYLHPQA